jgi:hypothetical protein
MNHDNNTGDNNGLKECPLTCPLISDADLSRDPWTAAGGLGRPAGGLRGLALTPRASGAAAGGPVGLAGGPRGAAVVKALVDYFKGKRGRLATGQKRHQHSTGIARPRGDCGPTHARCAGMTQADRVGICGRGRAGATGEATAARSPTIREIDTPFTPMPAPAVAAQRVGRHAESPETSLTCIDTTG